jgi:hypothetical protein
MDENMKNGLKKFAEDAETGIAKSILRWKYKKKGHPVPAEEVLEARSRLVADSAHDILAEKGKTVWNEIKEIYVKKGRRGEDSTK